MCGHRSGKLNLKKEVMSQRSNKKHKHKNGKIVNSSGIYIISSCKYR